MIPEIVPVSYPKRIPPNAANAEKLVCFFAGLRCTGHEDGRQLGPATAARSVDETHIDYRKRNVMENRGARPGVLCRFI